MYHIKVKRSKLKVTELNVGWLTRRSVQPVEISANTVSKLNSLLLDTSLRASIFFYLYVCAILIIFLLYYLVFYVVN